MGGIDLFCNRVYNRGNNFSYERESYMKISELKECGGAGLVRYTEKRVADYGELDKGSLIDSKEIDFGLVDSYGLFDLSELCFGVEERETEWLDGEINLGEHSVECDFDTREIIEFMAVECGRYFEQEIDGLELRLVEVFSPSEYNYTTDGCEFEVVKNPFDSRERLVAEMKKVIMDTKNGGSVNDEYRYYMFEAIDNYLTEHIAGYVLDNGEKVYSFDELKSELGGRND